MSTQNENLTSEQLMEVLNEKPEEVQNNNETVLNDVKVEVGEEPPLNTISINTLAQTLQLILSSSELDKYSLQLDPKLIKLLLDVIKLNPEYFNTIDNTISVILTNGKVDSSDIPNIIILLKELYKMLFELNVHDIKKGLNISSCELILKFIINVVLVDKISDQNQRTELLNSIDNIISIGAELITIRKILKNNKKSLLSCFSK
jgi:hypothetical protein